MASIVPRSGVCCLSDPEVSRGSLKHPVDHRPAILKQSGRVSRLPSFRSLAEQGGASARLRELQKRRATAPSLFTPAVMGVTVPEAALRTYFIFCIGAHPSFRLFPAYTVSRRSIHTPHFVCCIVEGGRLFQHF